jgi:hypothetical protein
VPGLLSSVLKLGKALLVPEFSFHQGESFDIFLCTMGTMMDNKQEKKSLRRAWFTWSGAREGTSL